MGQVLAARQQPLEGDRARDRTVVEKNGDRFARGQSAPVRFRRIDRAAFHRLRLMRLQNREQNPRLGQHFERGNVHGGLRQPHSFRLSAETFFEIANAPLHLRAAIAIVCQRQDHVVVGLGDRRAVSAEALAAHAVGVENRRVRRRRVFLKPAEKRRSEVETDRRVVVDDLHDAVVRVENARRCVRLVALGCDPLVPVVVRRGGVLRLHRLEPRVLPRRLVKMSVNADEASAHQGLGW